MPKYNRAARAARTLVHFVAILWKRKTCNYFIITIMLLTDFLFNVARPLCFLILPFGFALSTVLLVREITGRVFWPIRNYHPIEYFYTRRIFAFKRTHTIYVVFHSRGCYDVPRVFIVDARSFQALATILDYVYRSDARQDEFILSQVTCCEFQKFMTMAVVGDQPKKRANTSYKSTKKRIERAFLISNYY